jgi:hypothetical protein
MIIAKLNCTQMLVKAENGQVFLIDRRTPDRMELVPEDSPPKEVETTKNIFPFQCGMSFTHAQLLQFKQEA